MGASMSIKWAIREMVVGKRLPVFATEVWVIFISFVIGVCFGVAIGIENCNIISEAAHK